LRGLYANYVLPRIIDFAMRNKETNRLRAECIPRARGHVLEVGIGSGLNLPFYSAEVTQVYGVDPSLELQRIARKRHADVRMKVEFLTQSAEEPLPLGTASMDTAVITWTLCSIPDPTRALQQIKRVLKQNDHLIFVNMVALQIPGWPCGRRGSRHCGNGLEAVATSIAISASLSKLRDFASAN
jgi:ubiquinone/menaquinone biosynthesis C-methylase UbiE